LAAAGLRAAGLRPAGLALRDDFGWGMRPPPHGEKRVAANVP
jgi:hypothetical protein